MKFDAGLILHPSQKLQFAMLHSSRVFFLLVLLNQRYTQ